MEPFLEPISADSPTGEDLSYDNLYSELGVLILGTPETQFSEGKEPAWPQFRKQTEAGLKRSKDLQIGVYYAVALLQTEGIAGAAQGLETIAGFVRTYWDKVYPQLDPDDNDPTQRLNILSQLTVEANAYEDPIKYINRLSAASIIRVPGMAVTLDFVRDNAARLPEVMANANPDEAKQGIESLRRCVNAVHAMDDFLIETLGRSNAPSFDNLLKVLDKGLQPFDALTPSAAAAGTADGAPVAGAPGAATGPAGQALTGEVRSREDVVRAIDKICAFYAAVEPGSPVPYLLKRAQRLIGKDFRDLVKELSFSDSSNLDMIFGAPPEE